MPRRLGVAALFAAGIAGGLIVAGPATPAKRTVAITGRAYAFNHSETGLAGATIRVRELPGASATTDAAGDYELEVPDDANVTPYIDPPPGYNQIDLQTFHTRGRPIENANFQTPADAEYNGLAALLGVPLGPDGRPQQCVIVTTASARNVRGVDFATFQARTPHGVAGATAGARPPLPAPVYFNDSVIPDRSQAATSGDGGIIWAEVPAGTYRVIARSPSTSFASFLATCEPGRVVNANPPWGAYELKRKEKPLAAGSVAGTIVGIGHGSKAGRRFVIVSTRAAERLRARFVLRQGGDAVGRREAILSGFDKTRIRDVAHGDAPERITITLTDAAGDKVKRRVRLSSTEA